MVMKERIVVLLSGGLDSAVAAWVVASGGDVDLHCLTFDYGQRHRVEINHASRLAVCLRAQHRIIKLEFEQGPPLLSSAAELGSATLEEAGANSPAYIPGRNTVFLAQAMAYAEAIGASEIHIAANREDQAGFPDCRDEYFSAWNYLTASLATSRPAIDIISPFGGFTEEADCGPAMSKAEIVSLGADLEVPFASTLSCYNGTEPFANPLHCGRCDACVTRKVAFEKAGIEDPTRYAVDL